MKRLAFPSSSTRLFAFAAALLVMVVTIPVPAWAATLRGRLVYNVPGRGQAPAGGVTVTVFRQDIGRSAPSVTDANGMYYLTIPQGQYWLEIWVTNPPRAYNIQVVEPNTDIPPIIL